jgi:hypothetical protein
MYPGNAGTCASCAVAPRPCFGSRASSSIYSASQGEMPVFLGAGLSNPTDATIGATAV